MDGFKRFNQILTGLVEPGALRRVHIALEPVDRFSPGDMRAQPRMIVSLSGTRIHRWLVDGVMQTTALAAGDVLVSAPHSLNYTAYYEANHAVSFVFSAVDIRLVEISCEPPVGSIVAAGRPVHEYETDRPIDERGRGVIAALLARGRTPSPWIDTELVRILLETTRTLVADHSQPSDLRPDLWGRIHAYMLENFAQGIGRDSVAQTFGIHPNYLSRICREQTGATFIGTLTDLRLEHAASLLQYTDMKIQDISHDCGFASVSHFNRVFRSRFDSTPTRHRRKLKSINSNAAQ